MENTIYIGLSRLSALQTHMDLIANNIANINTPGYKANKMVFREYLDKPEGMKETMSMVAEAGSFRVAANGPIKMTGNPYDLALQGPGFFGVQGPGGKTLYTRAGAFAIDANGNLITQQGYPVLDAGGGTLTLPAGAKNVTISADGTLSTAEGTIGTLMVQEFPNVQSLQSVGDTLYKADKPGTQSEKTQVVQGALEGSNTQGILEMADMIDVSRNYQGVARMLQNEHDRIRATIKSLTSGQ
jgi:flagellar basal-body rod protein FlgF